MQVRIVCSAMVGGSGDEPLTLVHFVFELDHLVREIGNLGALFSRLWPKRNVNPSRNAPLSAYHRADDRARKRHHGTSQSEPFPVTDSLIPLA